MLGSLTKIPVRQLKILILNPLSLLVYSLLHVYSGWYAATGNTYLNLFIIQIESNISLHFTKIIFLRLNQWGL